MMFGLFVLVLVVLAIGFAAGYAVGRSSTMSAYEAEGLEQAHRDKIAELEQRVIALHDENRRLEFGRRIDEGVSDVVRKI